MDGGCVVEGEEGNGGQSGLNMPQAALAHGLCFPPNAFESSDISVLEATYSLLICRSTVALGFPAVLSVNGISSQIEQFCFGPALISRVSVKTYQSIRHQH